MTAFAIKGWCPGALHPMLSGDGLVVRLRPRGGRLSAVQAVGIAELSQQYGNGLIDLTSRANLQIRGVREQSHEALVIGLDGLGLVDDDRTMEAQRNIIVAPFWTEGDDTHSLVIELERAFAGRRLGLPEKFGFAIDCGVNRVLARAPADVRIERGADGGLIVRADGAQRGRTVSKAEAVDAALSLAEWFVASGGARGGRGRMAAHLAGGARLPEALSGEVKPAPAATSPNPGIHASGALVGLALGQMPSETLDFIAGLGRGLRLTPWRMILIEDLCTMPQHDGLVTRAGDPLLRVVACTGAPACSEALAETRSLAASLAPHLGPDICLHVSGCAKGCAHPNASDITLVGTPDGFDVVRDGSPRDVPAQRGLGIADVRAIVGAR
jgi:precorrin-3B synthase